MELVATNAVPSRVVGLPEWIVPTLIVTPGRDPLGLQTITIDRAMPRLVPGILALSRRARYFSYYAFLLHEYRERRLTVSTGSFSAWLKAREYEFALAVQLCPHGCGHEASGVVGRQEAARGLRGEPEAFARRESVESFLGGYGLYYRTPMIALGLVAPAGTRLGDGVTAVDVLHGERAEALARAFLGAIAPTAYFAAHMYGLDPIPRAVIGHLAERCCLCRLPDFPEEQRLLREALFAPPPAPTATDEDRAGVEQRRRSFAFFLRLAEREPTVTQDDATFRRAIWDASEQRESVAHAAADTAGQWAALIGKEYMQEGLSCLWADLCRRGLAEQPPDGFSATELDAWTARALVGSGELSIGARTFAHAPNTPTGALGEMARDAFRDAPLEVVRAWAVAEPSALSGLALLLALRHRLPDADVASAGWREIAVLSSDQQPGLLPFVLQFDEHLAGAPTLADTVTWFARRHVLLQHETIAYGKLPYFTFRFRWEQGRLRFYDLRDGEDDRFGMTDIRREAMARISQDVGLWEADGDGTRLTEAGRRFAAEVFG